MQLYIVIIGQMLETSPAYGAEYTTVDAVCAAQKFPVWCRTCRIIEKGWFGIFERESVNHCRREPATSPSHQLENGETAAVPDAA